MEIQMPFDIPLTLTNAWRFRIARWIYCEVANDVTGQAAANIC